MAVVCAAFSCLRARWAVAVLVFMVSAAVVWAPSLGRKGPPEPAADAVSYLTIAYHLAHHHVLSDPGTPPHQTPPPGNMMVPLYPAFLAGVMQVDETFSVRSECFLQQFYGGAAALSAPCATLPPEQIQNPRHWGSILTLQRLIAAGGLALVWLAARRLGCGRRVAMLALGLAAASGAYGEYGQQILTEGITLPLGTAVSLILVEAVRTLATRQATRSVIGWWLLVGGAFAVCALVRPTFVYLFYLTVAGLLVAGLWAVVRKDGGLIGRLVIAAGGAIFLYAVLVLPWMLRNHDLFGTFALTGSYGGYILAQRVAYNAMTAQEWVASLLFWLPDFGDSVARLFFPPEVLERLDWYSPNAYYVLGNGAWMEDMVAQAGSKDALLGWLLREKVLGDLGAHLIVTFSLALRGLWVSKYFGLIGFVFWLPSLIQAIRHQRGLWLVFCAPAVVLLGLQAFVSVSIPRYNLLVIPCMALAAAPLLDGLFRTLGRRMNTAKDL